MIKRLVFLLAAALLAVSCFAAAATENNSFVFSEVGLGARSAAMAGAYTAISDMESMNWNPGAVGLLDQASLALAYTKWNLSTGFQNILFNYPMGFGVAGLNISYASMGSTDGRDDFGNLTNKSVDASSFSGSLVFAAPVNKFASAGGAIRFFSQTLAGESMYSVLLDAGLYAKIADNFTAGFGVKNIGFTQDTSGVEAFSLGGSYVTDPKDQNRLLASVDVKYSLAYGTAGNLGLEYTFFNDYKLRAGYELKNENNYLSSLPGLSFGAGANISGIEADYAAVSYGDLGLMHTVSVSFKFAGMAPQTNVYERLVSTLAGQYMADAMDASDEGNYEKALRKLESLKSIMPDYAGLDEKMDETRKLMDQSGLKAKVEGLFNIGMDYYMRGKYQDAAVKWEEAKKYNPDFPGINAWLKSARKASEHGIKAEKSEVCFKNGMNYYNKCLYNEALATWEECKFEDPSDERLIFLRGKCKEMSDKIKVKEGEAEKYLNGGEFVEGVKKVRVILTLCPTSEFATEKLDALKGSISKQVEKYYSDGLEQYTNEKVVESIQSWEKVVELDPASNTAASARENIEKAKKKLKNLQLLK